MWFFGHYTGMNTNRHESHFAIWPISLLFPTHPVITQPQVLNIPLDFYEEVSRFIHISDVFKSI